MFTKVVCVFVGFMLIADVLALPVEDSEAIEILKDIPGE